MSKLQVINVQINKSAKLFFISVHDEDSKNIGVRVNYSKAVYAFNQQMAGNGSKVSHVFDSGFHLALMNTNLADWSDFRQAGTFTLDEAHAERARLVSIYEGMGLRNAGAQHIKRTRSGSGKAHAWGKGLIKSMPQAQFFQLFQRTIIGLEKMLGGHAVIMRNQAYLSYTRGEITTKGEMMELVHRRIDSLQVAGAIAA